jgi:hypothetical protein
MASEQQKTPAAAPADAAAANPAADATVTPPAPDVTEYDAMSAAFDELVVEPDASSNKDEDPPAPSAAQPTTPTTPAATDPASQPAAGAATDESSSTSESGSAAEGAPQAETDYKALYEALKAKEQPQPQDSTDKVEQPKAPAAAEPPRDPYNEDEKKFLAQYETEWPDIVRGESLRRRSEYQQIVAHVFSEINKAYGPLIERGAAAAEQVAEQSTLSYITSKHADYDDQMYEDVVKWAGDLPGFKGTLARNVIENGEPQDVVDLITEFKTSTGRKPRVVAAAAPASAATPATPTELSAAAKKAARALGVVETKRTAAAPNATDPDDFNSAWEEAVGSK